MSPQPLIGSSITSARLSSTFYQASLPSYPHAVAVGGALPALIPLEIDESSLRALCRGIQVLNVALGGILTQDILDEIPTASRHDAPGGDYNRLMHTADVIPGPKLHTALRSETVLTAMSLHHQSLKTVLSSSEVTVCASDSIIEGVEYPDRRFIIGVQWHPEAMVDHHSPMLALFQSLTRAASI